MNISTNKGWHKAQTNTVVGVHAQGKESKMKRRKSHILVAISSIKKDKERIEVHEVVFVISKS